MAKTGGTDTLPHMAKEHRTAPREALALPVQVTNAGTGTTCDISATGMFFEIDQAPKVGSEVELEIELDAPGGAMRLKARGSVVRLEARDGRMGVAVKLVASELRPAD